jgi:hypothetical protein
MASSPAPARSARAQKRAAAGDGGTVGLDRKSHPGRGNERLMREERRREPRQDQDFNHGKDHHERRDEHGHSGTRADGAAGRNRGGDAADRNAGGERRRPFTAEAEPLAGDEINDRPIDEISLDDRRNPAQHQRACEIEPRGKGDGEEAAEDHDRNLDVELGPDRVLQPFGEARKEIGDDDAGE